MEYSPARGLTVCFAPEITGFEVLCAAPYHLLHFHPTAICNSSSSALMAASLNLDETYGALYIGGVGLPSQKKPLFTSPEVLFATFFQGVLTVQVYIYYTNFPGDSRWLKTLIAEDLDGAPRRTNFILRRIMQYAVATGLTTSIVVLGTLVAYLLAPDKFIFIAVYFSSGRMYTNALLVSLNARRSLRSAMQQPFSTVEIGAWVGPTSLVLHQINSVCLNIKLTTSCTGFNPCDTCGFLGPKKSYLHSCHPWENGYLYPRIQVPARITHGFLG
ncbi:hypothetical protein C8F01DRAFT_1349999 [Mycena amicta]|nr:hypothetical protein C8F01DRAFT_1349999 [Mycena amicta]